MFVSQASSSREMYQEGHVIYGSKRNLSGKLLKEMSSRSDQVSGLNCPKSGRNREENTVKKSLFSKLFETLGLLVIRY